MLKYPSPAELELDKIRAKLWREADRDPDKLVEFIRIKSREVLAKHGYYVKPTGPNIGMIMRDKGKNKYKA